VRLLKLLIVAAAVLAGTAALAQVEEIFSKYVQVFSPQGDFSQHLIRVSPPGKKEWRPLDDQRHGFRLSIPEGLDVDTKEEGNRTLRIFLAGEQQHPRPVLRVDVYPAGKNDPTDVDADYAKRYAEDYPTAAFNNKFLVTDSGLVQLAKGPRLALVGGAYPQGAVRAYRVQLAHLSADQQLFITFDCPEADWPKYEDTVAQIVLSLEFPKEKREKRKK
jgi:hypothetical protein